MDEYDIQIMRRMCIYVCSVVVVGTSAYVCLLKWGHERSDSSSQGNENLQHIKT
jgi:hypothetical protein